VEGAEAREGDRSPKQGEERWKEPGELGGLIPEQAKGTWKSEGSV
jgi:hypothetical protein